MKQTGATTMVFSINEKKVLLVRYNVYNQRHWDFPKGKQKKGEKLIETAKREIYEETGLIIKNFDLNFKAEYNYSYTKDSGELVEKRYNYFLAKIPKIKKIKISKEHSDYIWATFEEAMNLFEFDSQKEILRKVKNYLEN